MPAGGSTPGRSVAALGLVALALLALASPVLHPHGLTSSPDGCQACRFERSASAEPADGLLPLVPESLPGQPVEEEIAGWPRPASDSPSPARAPPAA